MSRGVILSPFVAHGDHQAHLEFHVGSIDEQEALVLDCFRSRAQVCIASSSAPTTGTRASASALLCTRCVPPAHRFLPQNQRGMAHMLEHVGSSEHAAAFSQRRAQ